mmetsp:Transcript_14709/g.35660  ORF Transcript_14709/g.35660 Transcript_14709/m.35660 type:complete len:85 (-) Transcript_14709:68-322(-)
MVESGAWWTSDLTLASALGEVVAAAAAPERRRPEAAASVPVVAVLVDHRLEPRPRRCCRDDHESMGGLLPVCRYSRALMREADQ